MWKKRRFCSTHASIGSRQDSQRNRTTFKRQHSTFWPHFHHFFTSKICKIQTRSKFNFSLYNIFFVQYLFKFKFNLKISNSIFNTFCKIVRSFHTF
jgi:hypothetical protein